jgi:hypothetical protein
VAGERNGDRVIGGHLIGVPNRRGGGPAPTQVRHQDFGFQSLIAVSVLMFSNQNQFQTISSLLRLPPSAISPVVQTGACGGAR